MKTEVEYERNIQSTSSKAGGKPVRVQHYNMQAAWERTSNRTVDIAGGHGYPKIFQELNLICQ